MDKIFEVRIKKQDGLLDSENHRKLAIGGLRIIAKRASKTHEVFVVRADNKSHIERAIGTGSTIEIRLVEWGDIA